MVHIEGEERDFWSALELASETITTVGYGADADWKHPAMVLYVIGLQLLGVALIYMIVPEGLCFFARSTKTTGEPRHRGSSIVSTTSPSRRRARR